MVAFDPSAGMLRSVTAIARVGRAVADGRALWCSVGWDASAVDIATVDGLTPANLKGAQRPFGACEGARNSASSRQPTCAVPPVFTTQKRFPSVSASTTNLAPAG